MRTHYACFSCTIRRWVTTSALTGLLAAYSTLVAAQATPNNPSQDQDRNWTLERTYDGNGNVVAESKSFSDALGRPTQTQARNAATKQVFATQTVYSTGGQPVLQTLAAPINNQGFSYRTDFITAGGTPYGPANFELSNAYSPSAVDASTPGTLGYYFSQLNAQEPLTPLTSYPFSLTELYEGPMGGVKRAAGPGDELRMGKGREAKGRDFPLRKEFDDYIRLRPQFVPGSPQATLEYQGLKSVSINADGREGIVVVNKEGQAIISCLSGPQYPALPVFGFISAEATNPYDANAPVYQDIHIPAAGPQEVKFTMGSYATSGGKIRIVNLLTDQVTDYPIAPPASPGAEPELHVTLDPGFYRFVSVEGTQWSAYDAHYGNFSYTYYDDAGRVIATIAPNGLPIGGNYVLNPGFEQDGTGSTTISAWQNAGTPSGFTGTGSNSLPRNSGFYCSQWSPNGHDTYTYQVVQGLANGTYTARAWVKRTAGNSVAQFIAEGYGAGAKSVDLPLTYDWGAWQQVQLSRIAVTNGQCQLTFHSASAVDGWIIFDDVELVRQEGGGTPSFVTRNSYDTSGRLLATESNDEGRSEYVYAKDGRIRFSQSALQRGAGRFSYSNYDQVGRVVESGEYTPDAAGVEFESHASYGDKLAGSQLLEAEGVGANNIQNGHPNGSGQPNVVPSASGGADIGWLNTPGHFVRWANVVVPQTGSYELQFGYATGSTAPKTMSLLVNTQRIKQLQFAGTGDWYQFATTGRHVVTLNAGTNAVQVRYDAGDTGDVDLDYLRVIPPVSSAIRQEAEAASFVNANNNQPGSVATASGGQDVNWLTSPGTYVRFALSAPRAGTYTLRLRYSSGGNGARTMSLLVNEAPAQQVTLPSTSNWDQFTTYSTTATLRAGTNTVQVLYGSGDTGNVDIDYLEAEGGQLPALTHPLSVQDIVEDRTRTGGLSVAQCSQRNQVWYDLPFDGTSGSQGNDSQLNGRQQAFTIGAVTKTQNDNVTTWYSYDELGRVTWVVQDITGVGVKTLDYQYDFSGNVLTVAYQQNQPDAFFHYYTYDATQRLTKVETSPDGAARTTQAEYSYYLHGPLKRVQVAGNLQGVDYTYTLQGALKAINHVNPTLEPGHDSPQRNGVQKDLFALTLDYFSGDYQSRDLPGAPPVAGGPGVPTRYDGTIQGAAWRTAATTDIHRVAYTYDEKSQLQNSQYGQWQRQAGNGSYLLNSASTSALREGGLTYDPNGNIQSLLRTNEKGTTADNFSYTYKPNTNQLSEVHTGSQSGATVLDYDYDALGQMTRQRDEQGQRYFSYDVTGKTTGVYLDAARQQPVVTFAYDDRGFRVSKTAYINGVTKTTYYVRDVAGNVLAVYDKPTASSAIQRTEVPLYGASRVGTLTRLDDGSQDYRYELNDHLGDARVVFHKPTTTTDTETMELSGVSTQAAFQNDNLYRAPGGYAGSYAARLTDTQPAGQELKRVLTVAKGDTITFSAWGKLDVQGTPVARLLPALVLGTAAMPAESPQTGPEGQRRPAGSGRWLGRLAAGLGITLSQRTTQQTQTLQGWIKYRVLDDQGQQVGTDMVYLSGNNWQHLQLGVRVGQGGTVEVIAGTSGSGQAAYFDELMVEQTGGLIVQEQHQYAFGAPLPGLSYTVGNMRYRHEYQGQYAEKDAETGFDSFELRLYNSRIGRWISNDPYGQFSSPYVGMGNNPVSALDPNGGFSLGPGPKPWGIAATVHEIGEVTVRASQSMSAYIRIGLQVASSVGRRYMEYSRGFYGSLVNGALAGAPDATMSMFGYRRDPASVAEAAGQFVGNTVVVGWGLLNMAVGATGMGGGGALSLTGIGATLGAPIAAAGAVDFGYGLLVTGTGYVGLINSGQAILNMAAEHTKGARPSTKGKHEKGQANKRQARGGEKGDANRGYPSKRPPNHKGPWPPPKK